MRAIGDKVYWVYSDSRYGKSVPCPMCFGKGVVTIILGDESQTKIECGYCSHGLERATGRAKVWEPVAEIRSGEISGITKEWDGYKYKVGYESLQENEIYNTKEEAEPERRRRHKEEIDRSEKHFRENFKNAKKSQVWSAGYHRNQIKSAKREIEWHELWLGMIKSNTHQGQGGPE